MRVVFDWEFRIADLNDRVPLDAGTVDAIYANQVIEHIINPIDFLKEIKRVLKPGGTAILTTPNIRYIRHIIRLVTSGYGPRTANNNIVDGAWDDGHLHYFTHSDLAMICEKQSFGRYYSQGFVRNHNENLLRFLLDKYSNRYFVREFFTGNIFLVVTK